MMRRLFVVVTVGVFLLAGCHDAKKPNAENFKAAIRQHLEQSGDVCVTMPVKFPVDKIRGDVQGDAIAIEAQFVQLAALKQAGLLRSDSLGERYEIAEAGQGFVHADVQSTRFCYGHKEVDAVRRWSEPMTLGSVTATQVTYTYTLKDIAPWAQRAEVQRAFPDVKSTIEGAAKTEEGLILQLTGHGWVVPQ